jgi:hypothetical protein
MLKIESTKINCSLRFSIAITKPKLKKNVIFLRMVQVGRQKYRRTFKKFACCGSSPLWLHHKIDPQKKKRKKALVINSPMLLHNNKGPEWEEEGEWRMAGKR